MEPARLDMDRCAGGGIILSSVATKLPRAAAMSLDEFMLSLVLAQHPHNYSDRLRARQAPDIDQGYARVSRRSLQFEGEAARD